ncbi:16S rRNA (cytosine(1402)-N(4))-methyltransferase RsmH [Patescibacteria group bacterium]
MKHVPVLRDEVQSYLALNEGNVVADLTLGLGGHSKDILSKIGEGGVLVAFEQDERNLKVAQECLKQFSEQIIYINDNFRYLKTRITGKGIKELDAILLDLGISSVHVDEPDRGFSFLKEGPLDMRFNPNQKLSAELVVNTYSESELRNIFYKYGEEKAAPKIAREICKYRKDKEISSTVELANLIEAAIPKHKKKGKSSHPATKIFQALRIEVNDELSALEEVLLQSFEVLKPGGRIVVISYHSLEDRIVKHFFKSLERPEVTSPEQALYQSYGDPLVEKLTKKPVIPNSKEIEINSRSRSAKLRAYKKL